MSLVILEKLNKSPSTPVSSTRSCGRVARIPPFSASKLETALASKNQRWTIACDLCLGTFRPCGWVSCPPMLHNYRTRTATRPQCCTVPGLGMHKDSGVVDVAPPVDLIGRGSQTLADRTIQRGVVVDEQRWHSIRPAGPLGKALQFIRSTPPAWRAYRI